MAWKPRIKNNPERQIQDAIGAKLRKLGWVVKDTHGNVFQFGLPDMYVAHRIHGARWIEVKNPKGYKLEASQREFFHQLASVGVGVWILFSDDDSEIAKLFKPANWIYCLEVWK